MSISSRLQAPRRQGYSLGIASTKAMGAKWPDSCDDGGFSQREVVFETIGEMIVYRFPRKSVSCGRRMARRIRIHGRFGREGIMDRCWIFRPACCAGLVVCVCLLAGCGGESPAPGEPDSPDALTEAPPFEPDSPQPAAGRYQAGLSRLGENQTEDSASGLLIPPSNRGALQSNEGEEPPLPDSVLSQAVGAGDGELRLPLDRRSQPTPPGSEEPPRPETLALPTTPQRPDATLTSSAEMPVTTDAAPVADMTTGRPLEFQVSEPSSASPVPSSAERPHTLRAARKADVATNHPLEIQVSEPTFTSPVRPLPEAPRTLSATPMVDSATDHPLRIQVSEPTYTSPVRSFLNTPPTLRARASGPETDRPLKIQLSEPSVSASARSPSTREADTWSAVIKRPATATNVAREEPQLTPRMTIPVAEPVVSTPSASVMKLRPAPAAAHRPKTMP